MTEEFEEVCRKNGGEMDEIENSEGKPVSACKFDGIILTDEGEVLVE